jgi:Mce-associated membrane protein
VRKSRTPDEPASRRAVVGAAVLAVLTVGALVLAGIFGFQVRSDAKVADAREQAPAAAERAAKALFSYDYRHLPADRDRAAQYVTDSFGKEYLKNFTQLEKQKDGSPGLAVQSKTVVTANVAGSGVVDAEDGVARVLVYVNQTSTKADGKPQIFQNRVSMTMRQDGNRWLVDGVKSY